MYKSVRPDQREYRSRKTRKKDKRARKGRGEDEVSAAFKEAELSADAAQRRRTQSETLEALFEIFFRALKHCTASGLAAASHAGAPLFLLCSGSKFWEYDDFCRRRFLLFASCLLLRQDTKSWPSFASSCLSNRLHPCSCMTKADS